MLEFREKGGSVDFFRLGGNRSKAIDAPFVRYVPAMRLPLLTPKFPNDVVRMPRGME